MSGTAPMNKYKLVFLGDIFVGKTALITRFMYDTFENNYQATIGIDFLSKTMYLGDRTIRLQLWDTAGQERFRSLIPNYIRDSSVAIIVFDVSNKQTFTNIDKWIEDVRKERGTEAIIIIVGNKTDKVEERVVTPEEANDKAKEHSCAYVETSAKTGQNVQGLFNKISSLLPAGDAAVPEPADPQVIKIDKPPETSQNSNCKC